MTQCGSWFVCGMVVLFVSLGALAQESEDQKLTPNSPREPVAKTMSLANSAAFLDRVALDWTRERKCGSCHTSYAYLMARPALGDHKAPALLRLRRFFEERVANWDSRVESA